MMKLTKIYLADLEVGNVYLHNLHWNVEGLAFKQVHEYLEHLYDEFFEMYDAVAERMRMDGDMAPASVKEYLELTDLKERGEEKVKCGDAVKMAHDLLEHMRAHALEIREKADEKGEFAWVAMMEDHVAFYDKELWFLREMMK